MFTGLNILTVFSQNPSWTANLFDQKVFVENKGQFDGKDTIRKNQIRYAYSGQGVEIYFTSRGLTYRHDEIKQLSKEEKEKNKSVIIWRVIN